MLPHRSVRERRGTSSTARVSEVAHTKEQTRLPGAAVEGSNSLSCAGSIPLPDAPHFCLAGRQQDEAEMRPPARTCPKSHFSHDGQFAQFTMGQAKLART